MRIPSPNRNDSNEARMERGVHAASPHEVSGASNPERVCSSVSPLKRRERRAPLAVLSAVAVLTLLAGCATPVQTESKPGANFAAYHTFALMPLPQTGPASDPGLMLRLAEPAQDATTSALTAKGFQPAERKKADFAVNLRGSSLPKVEVKDWGYTRTAYTRRYGHVPVHVHEVDARSYNEQTLTVEIFDNKSHELVWVGWVTRQTSGRQVKPEKLKEAISAILEKFPPHPRAK